MDIKNYVIFFVISNIVLIVYLIYRICLAKTVEIVLISKKIENYKVWKILTFFFGIIVVAICYFINRNIGESVKENSKKIKKRLISTIIFGMILLALIPVEKHVSSNLYLELSKLSLGSDIVSYLDSNNNVYYRYDKMGNKYTLDNMDNFKYYDADGNAYVDSSREMAYYCYETLETIEYDCAYIDESGYMVEKNSVLHTYDIDDDYYVYYDDKGNLFYFPGDCSWDENGNLIFKDKAISHFTYDDIK